MNQAYAYLSRFDEILDQMQNAMLFPNFTQVITENFIVTMIPHHEAAILMCQNLLRYTTYLPLIRIANQIIRSQQESIEQMRRIYASISCCQNTAQEVDRYTNTYYQIVFRMLNGMENSAQSENINFNFVTEMIPHHEGAIGMCQNALSYPIDARLRAVCQKIIKEQSENVTTLRAIRNLLVRNPNLG